MTDGNLKVFEYGKDQVRANLKDVVVGQTITEQASLSFGSFMWQSSRDDGTIEVHQVKFCGAREYYSDGTCLPCGSQTQITTEFQQTECLSCGDIWYLWKEYPDSIHFVEAKRHCGNPADVYLAEHPEVAEALNTDEQKRKWQQRLEGKEVEEEENSNFTGIVIVAALFGVIFIVGLVIVMLFKRRQSESKVEAVDIQIQQARKQQVNRRASVLRLKPQPAKVSLQLPDKRNKVGTVQPHFLGSTYDRTHSRASSMVGSDQDISAREFNLETGNQTTITERSAIHTSTVPTLPDINTKSAAPFVWNDIDIVKEKLHDPKFE